MGGHETETSVYFREPEGNLMETGYCGDHNGHMADRKCERGRSHQVPSNNWRPQPQGMSAISLSLRGVGRRSNLTFGQLEIASGFALAMTVFESLRVIKTDTTFKNPYTFENHDEFVGQKKRSRICSAPFRELRNSSLLRQDSLSHVFSQHYVLKPVVCSAIKLLSLVR